MNYKIVLFIIILTSLWYNNSTDDMLGISGPLEFGNTIFELKWADKPGENYYLQEYIPAKESLERFNEMLSYHLFVGDFSAKDLALNKIKELEERKKDDILCNYEFRKSADGKSFIVDFIVSEIKDDKVSIVEFNVYKFEKAEILNDESGVLVFAYTKRKYEKKALRFLKGLKDERFKKLNLVAVYELPVIDLN